MLVLPSSENLALFALASLLLALTPGPNLLYLISRTLCQGRRAGLVSLAGTSLGLAVHVTAAALGLSAIFIAVPALYDVLRYVGAAYLLWLAWNALKREGRGLFVASTLPPDSPWKLFRSGLFTSVLNPKVAIFYLALFPQFVDAGQGGVLAQSFVLGLIQVSIGTLSDFCFVLAAGAITSTLARHPIWAMAQRWLLGVVFTGIALRLAFDSRR